LNVRLNILAAACLSIALSACAALESWKPDDRYRELPYAQGKLVEAKYTRHSCAMCPTGSTGESAYFLGDKRYAIQDVGPQAERLIVAIQKKEGWQKLGTNFYKEDRYFSPIRILLISIDPIVVVTVPWQHKTNLHTGFAEHNLLEEANSFSQTVYQGNNYTFIPLYWPRNLDMPIEIRHSLPAGVSQARVVTANRDTTTVIRDGRTVVELDAYRLVFNRAADGKVLTSFEPR
jgi:hypothetical protein